MSLELFSMVAVTASLDTFGSWALSSLSGSDRGTEIYLSRSALIKDLKDMLSLLGGLSANREHRPTLDKESESESPTLFCSSTCTLLEYFHFILPLQYISEAILYFYTKCIWQMKHCYFTESPVTRIKSYQLTFLDISDVFNKISWHLQWFLWRPKQVF